jgi:hypothetical protein
MQSGADFMETHTEPSSKSNVQNASYRAATEWSDGKPQIGRRVLVAPLNFYVLEY